MVRKLNAWISVAAIAGSLIAVVPVAAQALKGAGTCNDEYKANKPALRAAKEKKSRLHRCLPRACAGNAHADRRRGARITLGAGRAHVGRRDLQDGGASATTSTSRPRQR